MEKFTVYQGQLNSHQKPHGTGKMRWITNGDTYEGEFKYGFPCGFGVMTYATMQYTYVGEFLNGKRHGIGRMILESGELICGSFKDDVLDGYCVIYYKNGDYYEGGVSNSKKNGEGVIRYKSGDVYYGYWKDDQKHGVGKLTLPDGIQNYYGGWIQDSFSGRGKVTKYVENTGVLAVYEGEFLNGKLHGEGVLTDSIGVYYKGNFLNGNMHGAGELLLRNGSRYAGQFLYNKFVRGKGEAPDRSVAYGHFYNLSPEGIKLKVQYNDGARYEGGMKGGKKSGFGKYKTKAGVTTLANYEENQIHGDAEISFPDGSAYYASFINGKETATGIMVQSPKKKNNNKWQDS
jgi:hypothetical protein